MFFVCLLRVNNTNEKRGGVTVLISFQYEDKGKISAVKAHFQGKYTMRALHEVINYAQ